MNSIERTIQVNVSASNLFAQLYTLGLVQDHQEIVGMKFNPLQKGQTMIDKQWTEGTIIPLTLTIKENKEEVAQVA